MRVLIIEDHPMVIDGWVLQLKHFAPHCQIDRAMNWPQAHRLLLQSHQQQSHYDWVVLDVDLNQSGLAPHDLAARIRACLPSLVWVCSALDDPSLRHLCELSGARWMPKAIHGQTWHRLVHDQIRQIQSLTPASRVHASEALPDLAVKLTPRQLDVVALVAQGMTNADIARVLHVSEETVRSHLYDAFRALGLQNRTQAGQLYHRWQSEQPIGPVNS